MWIVVRVIYGVKHDVWAPQAQGCQMVSFQTKNPTLGIFWKTLEWQMLLYVMAIYNILRPSGIFHGPLVIL
jgi:hypothetical protein